jgi:hypothetical protein
MHEGKRVIIEELILKETNYHEEKDKFLLDQDAKLNICIESISLKPEGKKVMDRESFKN